MPAEIHPLSPKLVEQILLKLGFSKPPTVDIAGLDRLYAAWCHTVPFDNIRKRIHLAKNNPLPLPGHDDTEFFHGWLRFGVGGTCWAGNAALYTLLKSLGFSAELGTATMLPDSKQTPDHGSVAVRCEGKHFLVDASMLHNTPLLLSPNEPSSIDHPAWGLACTPLHRHWSIQWRPLHMIDGCSCTITKFPVTRGSFRQFNEVSRQRSPFNAALYVRINSGQSVIGISGGMSVNFIPSGTVVTTALSHESRRKLLIENMGISEEIIKRIPPDL